MDQRWKRQQWSTETGKITAACHGRRRSSEAKLKNDPTVHGFRWRRHRRIEEEIANLLRRIAAAQSKRRQRGAWHSGRLIGGTDSGDDDDDNDDDDGDDGDDGDDDGDDDGNGERNRRKI